MVRVLGAPVMEAQGNVARKISAMLAQEFFLEVDPAEKQVRLGFHIARCFRFQKRGQFALGHIIEPVFDGLAGRRHHLVPNAGHLGEIPLFTAETAPDTLSDHGCSLAGDLRAATIVAGWG